MGIREGVRSEPVSLEDVLPTILELVGLDDDSNLDGRSLVPLLRGESPAPARTLYALEPLRGEKDVVSIALSARRGRLKWIRVHGSHTSGAAPWPGACYDLVADPGEQRNLANLGPGPCAELARALESWRTAGVSEGLPLQVEPSTEQELRALGYLH
jgi:N-acetylglucosamine-6-sulfatase